MFLPEEAMWFVYLAGGRADVKLGGTAQELAIGEALLLQPDGGNERVVLNGGGELVLVKLIPV